MEITPREMEWISVKDRLPEMNQNCLVWVFGSFTKTAMYKGNWPDGGNAWITERLDHWPSDEVTHWMPSPEPPKQLDNGDKTARPNKSV